ncbi:MAG: helix-turn-helix transcriptional regulator [Nitrospirae bacterium]|nr:helix-turn-helix transcriptional regulator [Nitrospirota bacterium]
MTPKELQQWRCDNGYSQSQLAKELGVITIPVSRWERGEREIPPFLYLALKSLKKSGGEIKRGRPAVKKLKTEKRKDSRKTVSP